MALWDDERAQPVQIGFILVFAVLIISFAAYQAVFVPQQNAQVEFDHYQQVGQDVTDLRNDLVDAVGSNATRSASVRLGTTYPARVFALNPAPPSGTLATTDPGRVEVNGVSKNATQLCADASSRNTVESRSLTYRPSYNEYGPAKNVTYESTFVVRSFRDGERYGTQSLVEEAGGSGTNRINLRLLTNEFSESGTDTTSVDLEPSRTYEESFSPTGSFSVVVPSRFSPGAWEDEILADVDVVNRVEDADTGGVERVEIFFDTTVDYTVSCAAVGLNEQPAYQPPEPTDDGVDDTPTASIDYLEDTSAGTGGGGSTVEYIVGWNVSDDNRLNDIEIELINHNGRTVDSVSPPVSGTSSTGEATLANNAGFERQYVIKVTVTDSDGRVDTESVTDYADGN